MSAQYLDRITQDAIDRNGIDVYCKVEARDLGNDGSIESTNQGFLRISVDPNWLAQTDRLVAEYMVMYHVARFALYHRTANFDCTMAEYAQWEALTYYPTDEHQGETEAALNELTRQFKSRDVHKNYAALVRGVPEKPRDTI